MMMWNKTLSLIGISCFLLVASSSGFAPINTVQPQQAGTSSSLQASNRRVFMETAVASVGVAILTPLVSYAAEDVDDLSMPTESEKAAQDAAMAERLRRKAELQKEKARPATFQESLKKEQERKAKMGTVTQEERRNALCEELGRGC